MRLSNVCSAGDVIGKWTVLGSSFKVATCKSKRQHETAKPHVSESFAVMQCFCGAVEVRNVAQTKPKKTKACGMCSNKVAAVARTTHGLSRHPLYGTWKGMLSRVRSGSQGNERYCRYANLEVQEEWVNSFETFIEDVGLPPSELHTLDRIDNNGGYVRGNVRWATPSEQQNNRSVNVVLTRRGESKTVSEWAEYLGVSRRMLYRRADKGWCDERIFDDLTSQKEHRVTFDGTTRTIKEWSESTGIPHRILYERIFKANWSLERALTAPVRHKAKQRNTRKAQNA